MSHHSSSISSVPSAISSNTVLQHQPYTTDNSSSLVQRGGVINQQGRELFPFLKPSTGRLHMAQLPAAVLHPQSALKPGTSNQAQLTAMLQTAQQGSNPQLIAKLKTTLSNLEPMVTQKTTTTQQGSNPQPIVMQKNIQQVPNPQLIAKLKTTLSDPQLMAKLKTAQQVSSPQTSNKKAVVETRELQSYDGCRKSFPAETVTRPTLRHSNIIPAWNNNLVMASSAQDVDGARTSTPATCRLSTATTTQVLSCIPRRRSISFVTPESHKSAPQLRQIQPVQTGMSTRSVSFYYQSH